MHWLLTALMLFAVTVSDKLLSEKDSDGDGLSDLEEAKIYRTDIHRVDTDTDGLNDGAEIDAFSDPLLTDTDSDGFLDGVEFHHDSDPTDPDSIPVSNDLDQDGLSNRDEINTYQTDHQRVDTDFDGVTDFAEIVQYLTNPLVVDTDGDGYWDGEEVSGNSDPLDPDSHPSPRGQNPG